MSDYSQRVKNLFESQFIDWKLARDNYHQLDAVRVRTITFPGYEISVQFNPGRITSSAARVDAKSIEERPCFLCGKNRPAEQKGIPYGDECIILINPFPIFRRHLTIVSHSHTPQRIAGSFLKMLALSKSLSDYVVFYNGPQCGASAPDHLHFQAGNRGFLPLERDEMNPYLCAMVARTGSTELYVWKNYQRGILTLKGTDPQALDETFRKFYERFALMQPDRPEPMLNILTCFSNGHWTIHIIPRKAHRPACYFAEGEDRILLSPASVDLGGVLITPREEDFIKITADDINSVLSEVCLGEEDVLTLVNGII